MKNLAIVVLSLWAGLAGALTAQAQSITPITTFFVGGGPISPTASLTLGPDGNFYGTTETGGSGGLGNVFKVTTNGMLTTLVNFNNTNGSYPFANLTLGPDGNFYGTTANGGSAGEGTVFKMTTNGILTTLVSFNKTNGANPVGGLILGLDGNFYGTGAGGGSNGTVFKMTTNGTLTTLANFNNANGGYPYASMTLGPDGNLYGTTDGYGTGNLGTVFKVTTNGTLTTLVIFNGTNGASPFAGLTLGPDGNFYGTTLEGGSDDYGTVFQVTINGTLTTLVSFNWDNGAIPYAGLTLGPDSNLYGATENGGIASQGTLFKVTTNGTLTTLISLNDTNGASPETDFTLGPDGNFYSSTYFGFGDAGASQTIFRLDLPPDFITAPANQIAVIGSGVTFNSQVFGTGPFAYQWLSNGVPIDGASNATLTINQALANQARSYQLEVTNAFGSVTSQPVSLNVFLQPNIYAISNDGGGNFTVSLASLPNSTNRLWATTNPALPFAQWQVIATNATDGNGLSQFLDTNTAGMPQKFYRLSCP